MILFHPNGYSIIILTKFLNGNHCKTNYLLSSNLLCKSVVICSKKNVLAAKVNFDTPLVNIVQIIYSYSNSHF